MNFELRIAAPDGATVRSRGRKPKESDAPAFQAPAGRKNRSTISHSAKPTTNRKSVIDNQCNPATAPQFSFSTYDAFGNAMSPGRPPSQAGSFVLDSPPRTKSACRLAAHSAKREASSQGRGAEGSVYDAHPTLVYMQARHYDPTIGRFIQPDSVALASMTTQGMNKYIYCENDPVNFTDATGRFLAFLAPFLAMPFYQLAALGAFILGSFVGSYVAQLTIGENSSWFDALAKFLLMGLSQWGFGFAKECKLNLDSKIDMLRGLFLSGVLTLEAAASLLLRTLLGFLGIAFLIGFGVGFMITTMLLAENGRETSEQGWLCSRKWRAYQLYVVEFLDCHNVLLPLPSRNIAAPQPIRA